MKAIEKPTVRSVAAGIRGALAAVILSGVELTSFRRSYEPDAVRAGASFRVKRG